VFFHRAVYKGTVIYNRSKHFFFISCFTSNYKLIITWCAQTGRWRTRKYRR